jgi:hypothetical protein
MGAVSPGIIGLSSFCFQSTRGIQEPEPLLVVHFGRRKFLGGELNFQGYFFDASSTPALQHSSTPALQHSNAPTLQRSNTPALLTPDS